MRRIAATSSVFIFKAMVVGCVLAASSVYAGTNSGLSYQGRIIRPSGEPANSGTITFTLKVLDASSNCTLWSETQTVDMTGSQGAFSLIVGAGTRTDGGAQTLKQVFTNAGTLTGLTCGSGTTYTPTSTADRNLAVTLNDAGTTVSLSSVAIKSVPFALQADQISGYGILNIAKISGAGSANTFSPTQHDFLYNITAPASASATPCVAGEILKFDGTAWGCAADATGGSPGDASYAAKGTVQFNTNAATSGVTVAAGVATLNTGIAANQIPKLDASANLGVGTATPGSRLDVKGTLRLSGSTSGYVGFAPAAAAGSTTYTLPAADSTGSQYLKSDGAGNLSWGTPAGGVGDALVANPLSQFAATTSAQLSGVLSDETGTGAAVFGTSPTIVTPTFTTNITSPMIIGGTGTTSTLTYKTTTGVGAAGADHIFKVGNNGATEALRILNDGKVGIGTTSPLSPLDIRLAGTTYGTNLTIGNLSGGSYGSLSFKNSGADPGAPFIILGSNGDDLALGANNLEWVRIKQNGNVGIGTTSPGSALDVKGTVSISGSTSGAVGFAVPAAAGSAVYTWPAAAPASNKILQSDNTGALSWISAGGGGDAFVANPLSQFAATTSAQLSGVLSDETGTGAAVFGTSPTIVTPTFTTNITSPMIIGGTGTTSTLTYKTTTGVGAAGADHIFQVGNNGATEAMRILNDGKVGIGTATPGTMGSILDVSGIVNITGDSYIANMTVGRGNGSVVSNSAVGAGALGSNSGGTSNAAFGRYALNMNTSGSNNTAIGDLAMRNAGTGSNNTAVGNYALQGQTNADDNTAVGFKSGYTSVAANRNFTGIQNTYIGSDTGANSTTQVNNTTVIGYGARSTASNQVVLGNTSVTTTLLNGNVGIGTTSPTSSLDVKGTVKISGSTSGSVGFAVPAAAGSAVYTWPAAAPASDKVLQSDNTGALSWVSLGGGGDAFVANPLSQFAATTSAQLSGVLSDETGTGAAVFAGSPAFTGTPLSTTAAADTNTTQIATTAFVVGQASSTGPVMDGPSAVGTSLKYARADHVHPVDTSRAPAAGSTSITSLGTVTTGTWNATAIPVLYGGTGATTASGARTNLGLGTAAVVNTGNSVGLIPTIGVAGINANVMCTGDGTGANIICNTSIPTGDALVANPLSQFAATTSAQLSGVLSDETGTGAAVFGTSPTIVTPTFTTNITSPLIIGGTGTTSTLTYKTTTGVGATGADHVFQVGNNGATEAMRILNSGNVGIATTSPATKVDVADGAANGTLRIGADVNLTTQTANTRKIGRIVTPSYGGAGTGTNIALIGGDSTSAGNYVSIGGISGGTPYAATAISFLTAATTTTAGGTERMTIDSSGNVGIGTTAPATNFDVSSSTAGGPGVNLTKANSGTTNQNGPVLSLLNYGPSGFARTTNTKIGQIYFGASAPTTGAMQDAASIVVAADVGTGSGHTGTSTPSYMAFSTTSLSSSTATEKVRIDMNGNVGIGTASPTGILHADGGTAAAATNGTGITLKAQNAGTGNQNGGGIYLTPGTASGTGSPGAVFVNGGFFTISLTNFGAYASTGSTNSPPSPTVLVGNLFPADSSASLLYTTAYNSSANQQNAYFGSVSTTGAGSYTPNIVIGHATGAASYAERLRIDSSGRVGIGTASPQTTLQVEGVISPATNNTYALGNASYRFTEVFATNGVINTSDRREKKDIYNTDLGLNFINKLRPVSYRWNTGVDSDVHYGLIAQEAEQVIADLGKTEKTSIGRTSIVTHDQTTDRYGVRYSELIAPLIKAVQELYSKFLGVESDVAALKAIEAVKDKEIEKLKQENAAMKAYLCSKDRKAAFCR